MKGPILHLIPQLSGGGMERRMGIIAQTTNKKFQVHISYINKGPNYKDIYLDNVKLHKIYASNNYDLRIILKIFFLIIKVKPKVIQTWSIQMDIIGGFFCYLFSIKHILMEPISPENSISNKLNFKYWIKELIAKNATVVSNSNIAKIYWNKKGVKKSLIIRNGFDIKTISSSKNYKIPEYLESFLGSSKFIVLASRLSNTSKHKRTDLVIETFSKIIKKKPLLKLVICGDGCDLSFYKDLVNEYKMQSNVIFTGFVKRNELWAIFQRASLFISLSKYEGMPNSVIEAGLCKTPLLLSNIPTHLEVIPMDLAEYINNYNSDDLTKKIIDCIYSSNIKNKCQLLYKHLQNYSLEIMVDKYILLYNRLCKSN